MGVGTTEQQERKNSNRRERRGRREKKIGPRMNAKEHEGGHRWENREVGDWAKREWNEVMNQLSGLCALCGLCGENDFGYLGGIAVLFFKSFYQVVQSHRRLRHIAPGSFFGKIIGAERNSRGSATHPLAPRGIATELDRCQTGVFCGLAAAHLRCRHSGGVE